LRQAAQELKFLSAEVHLVEREIEEFNQFYYAEVGALYEKFLQNLNQISLTEDLEKIKNLAQDVSKKINHLFEYFQRPQLITNLPNELLAEILHAWEQWNGPAAAFYKHLGVDFRKMGSLMGKAKQLKRDGAFDGLNFTEVVVDDGVSNPAPMPGGCGIELVWENNKVIRFGTPDLLMEFLKKVA
jgi:hypothetical protein